MSDFNPFASLIESAPEPEAIIKTPSKSINSILEEVFGFTLNETHGAEKHLIFLEEVSASFNRSDLDIQVLQHALFDRLFMCNDDNQTIRAAKRNFRNAFIHETKVLEYLFGCYRNLINCDGLSNDERGKVKSLILENATTALVESDIYEGQRLEEQLMTILKEGANYCDDFFRDVCKSVLEDQSGGEALLKTKLSNLLLLLTSEIRKSNIISLRCEEIFRVLNLFATEEYLASVLLDTKPAKFVAGADYAGTPLGACLNMSILPKVPSGLYEHFQDPADHAGNSSAEGMLWNRTDELIDRLHTLARNMLTCSPQIKDKTLEWIGQCLKANSDRRKLWNSQAPPELNPANYTSVNDGFMINLGNVMLRLCQPFCSKPKQKNILKVDPTYSRVPDEQHIEKGIHLPGLSTETCLVPSDSDSEGQQPLIANRYNFVTECFYLAHKSIDLGYQVTVDKLVRLNHGMSRIERAYSDALSQGGGNSDLAGALKKELTQQLTKYLSLKAQLSDPVLLRQMFEFFSSSAYWLSQVAVRTDYIEPHTFAPLEQIPVSFPLSDQIPDTLKYIPEFLIENIVTYMVFLRRFAPKVFEQQGYDNMKPFLTFILVYMGSPERMKNPHLRARLAEALESLLPHHTDEPEALNSFGGYQREQLFTQHENRREVVASLLKVFVGIEMTGQNVEFEQKFNYRRPMYTVMDYLWTKDEYRNYFKGLAEEAEQNMEAVTPPLFLRFVNLLMNDAVYLLDEALSNMAKLKEMQNAKENGEWESLPAQERTQNMQHMHHTGMIAKFDNILGRDTIKMLEKLTSEITIVFTHSAMVDRVAAMLNYFLYSLVGPDKKNFKVKDQREYSFDPANTVLNICRIYVNLKENDSFCFAISQDGRSYSPQLFELAEDVLARIGGGALIGELEEVATRVAQKAREQQQNEDTVAGAPEHFLDPIMSTLMTDPVILPSSRQTVDRNTIARHLLSDQTDPFNRAPLSMDQVIPNTELATEINKWVEERRRK